MEQLDPVTAAQRLRRSMSRSGKPIRPVYEPGPVCRLFTFLLEFLCWFW